MTRRLRVLLLLLAAILAVGTAVLLARTDRPARRAVSRDPIARRGSDREVVRSAPSPDATAEEEPTVEEGGDAAEVPPAAEPERLPPIPPDPVETGPCTLFLRAVDVDTGEPVGARVQLWRLDAPGNEHWTDGDQRQATVDVPREGVLVEQLPASLYRLFVASQSASGVDPDPFHVAGHRTERTVPVRSQRQYRVSLRLLEPAEVPILRAHRSGTSHGWTVRWPEPEWRRERRLREPLDHRFGLGGGAGMGGSFRRWTAEAGDEGLFVLGSFQENSRDRALRVTTRFSPEGFLEVRVTARDLSADRLYEAVCVPDRGYEGLVRLPDGRDAAQAGANVSLWIEAAEVDPALPPGSTRNEPIHLRATLKGYRTVEAEFSRLGPPPVLVMEPNG